MIQSCKRLARFLSSSVSPASSWLGFGFPCSSFEVFGSSATSVLYLSAALLIAFRWVPAPRLLAHYLVDSIRRRSSVRGVSAQLLLEPATRFPFPILSSGLLHVSFLTRSSLSTEVLQPQPSVGWFSHVPLRRFLSQVPFFRFFE